MLTFYFPTMGLVREMQEGTQEGKKGPRALSKAVGAHAPHDRRSEDTVVATSYQVGNC